MNRFRIRGISSAQRVLMLAAVLALVASACSGIGGGDGSASTRGDSGALDQAFTAPPPPALDAAMISEGEQLYAQYCATCHKANLSGAPDWKKSNDDGVFPPPPHDNSGHTWHHPDDLLAGIVLDGLEDIPSGMPDFRGTLTEEEVASILEFFKSRWGDEERAFQWQVTWQTQQ